MTGGPRVPAIDARGLDGRAWSVPADLEGERNLVAFAFHRHQQADVDTWIPDLEAAAASDPAVRAYEIPTISRRWAPARRFIDGGMVAGIPDPAARARTLTAYTEVGRVTRALGLAGTDDIAIVLCDRSGAVAWMAEGPRNGAAAEALAAALALPLARD
ncbi:MAG: hypothetical protein U0R70_03130 [Solirubrobacteraceae bacterium]